MGSGVRIQLALISIKVLIETVSSVIRPAEAREKWAGMCRGAWTEVGKKGEGDQKDEERNERK